MNRSDSFGLNLKYRCSWRAPLRRHHASTTAHVVLPQLLWCVMTDFSGCETNNRHKSRTTTRQEFLRLNGRLCTPACHERHACICMQVTAPTYSMSILALSAAHILAYSAAHRLLHVLKASQIHISRALYVFVMLHELTACMQKFRLGGRRMGSSWHKARSSTYG
jgi:hypothetical protein